MGSPPVPCPGSSTHSQLGSAQRGHNPWQSHTAIRDSRVPPRGAAGRVHSGRGPGGGWLKWRQETGPGGVAPRLWRALRGETREAQAQLRQERETETGVPGGALSDLSHCASRASALFSDKRGDGARQRLLPPALLPSPAVFKKTHAFPLDLEIGAIRYGLSLSFSLS